jgi:three-Cys-motif partner protein
VAFTHATFVNQSVTHDRALRQRIERLQSSGGVAIPKEGIRVICDDANAILPSLMSGIGSKDYVFVFADIQNPSHWPWSSVEALKRGHNSVDLYVLFPIDMGLVRLASYSKTERDRWAPILTPFFGSDAWAGMADRLRRTDAQASEFRRALVELYLDQLRELWGAGNAQSVLGLVRKGDHVLYEMLFASKNGSAHSIVRSVRRQLRELQNDGQGELRLD